MTSMPPGWYDDGRGALRWWDGTQWTEHVAAPDPEPVPGAAGSGAAGAEPIDDIIPIELQEAPAGEHPSGYPGADSSGAFIRATEPKKSKLWILWVVLGVVLLGIVIAAAVILPLLFLSLTRGSAGGESVAPEGGAEAAAVAVVEDYDEAWRTGDCDLFTASTTQGFRDSNALTECVDFEEQSQQFSEAYIDYSLTVTSIDDEDGAIEVETLESYRTFIDDQGELVDEAIPGEIEYSYVVVQDGDRWAIDSIG